MIWPLCGVPWSRHVARDRRHRPGSPCWPDQKPVRARCRGRVTHHRCAAGCVPPGRCRIDRTALARTGERPMPMLAELADVIIGVDTHTDTHTAAAGDRLGAHLATIEVSADAAGYARLSELRRRARPGAADRPGQSRAAARTARAWPARSPPPGTWSSRPTGRGRPAAVAASPTNSTPCAPPARPWPSPATPGRAPATPARPCGSCWPPASTPPRPAPPPSTPSRR